MIIKKIIGIILAFNLFPLMCGIVETINGKLFFDGYALGIWIDVIFIFFFLTVRLIVYLFDD